MKPKEKASLKNMEYNRYLGLRYALALFFFANLNWLLALVVTRTLLLFIPLILLVYSLLPIYGQMKMRSKPDNASGYLKQSKGYFGMQMLANLLLIALSFNGAFFTNVFPFMADSTQGRVLLISLLFIGLLVGSFCLKKIVKIENQSDKGYKQLLKLKQTLKVSEENGK